MKKNRTITTYISCWTIAMILAMAFIMLVFVNIFAANAVKYDIRSDLVRGIRKNKANIICEDGSIKVTNQFDYVDEKVYFQVVDDDGEIIIGEYPQGVEINLRPRNGDLRTVQCGHNSYYVIERVNIEVYRDSGIHTYLRCVVNKKDISSEYMTMRRLVYVSVPVMLLVVGFCVIIISRQITEPLRQLGNMAESVGKNYNVSGHMEYNGNFTEIITLVDANNRMLDRIEQMFTTQKQFTSDVAHELRTPMTVIMAQCEYLQESNCSKEEYQEAIDVILRQMNKTNHIVTQLLNLSRLECDQTKMEPECVDLKEMIAAVCEDEQMKSESQLAITIRGDNVSAEVDVYLMTIALQNLVDNAVKYSEACDNEKIPIEVVVKKEKEEVHIRVTDHGCGMSDEVKKQIFQRFYRADQARSTEGFGLGLSLVDRIVELHNGRVEVDSKENVGSSFTIILPLFYKNILNP